MCGRLACGLQPEEILNSCHYKEPGGDSYTVPQWTNCHNSGKTYKPSYNICPSEVAPILLSGIHFKLTSRVIAPMIFGVIPQWGKMGNTIKYSTINCKVETIQTSKLYGNLLEKGQRCVVICNGYYEWQKLPHGKSPYFIHARQPEGVEIDNPTSWNLQVRSGRTSLDLKLLKLAALFQISSSKPMGEQTLSFTVITKAADLDTSWLHGRMPAILETKEQLDDWLNFQEVDANQAVQCILQKVSVICAPISSSVNTVTNKDISCIKKKKNFREYDRENVGSLTVLETWLINGQKRKSDGPTGNPSGKIKKEEV